MQEKNRRLLHELLDHHRVVALSLDVEGRPHASLLPFAVDTGYRAILVHASGLARHSRGLLPGAGFGAVIHFPDRLDADPLRLPRLLLEGSVEPLEKGSEDYEAAQRTYLAKLPQSERTFALGDFRLYRLVIERARLVAGFAQASDLRVEDLAQLADSPS